MEPRFRPLMLGDWGQPLTKNRRSKWTFKASWSDTLELIARELKHLGAKDFVLEADFRESDIRLDGLPRAQARQPEFPGIRVSFESKHGPLRYQTDTCEFWQHNVRSIALGLEALRAVDRHGISSRSEQYTGFKALPGPRRVTAEEATAAVYRIANLSSNQCAIEQAWRRAVFAAHPDRNGGNQAAWDELQAAGKILDLL